MGKRKNPPRESQTRTGGHYTRLYDDLIYSPAFIDLSPQAQMLLIYLMSRDKGQKWNLTGTVELPYSELVKVGYRHRSIPTWIEQLKEHGFVRVETNGGLYRTANKYTFISAWKAWQK